MGGLWVLLKIHQRSICCQISVYHLPHPPRDSILRLMTVWRKRGKIVSPAIVQFGPPYQLLALRIKLTSSGYWHTWAWTLAAALPCSSRPRSQAREHASTAIRSYRPSATEAFKRHQRSIADERYLSGSHARVLWAFTGSQQCYQCWQWNWSRDQCIMAAQVHTGHSLLSPAYLHRIGHWDSAICPHCQGTEETVEHLVFQCLAHDQARRHMWPGDCFSTDPWHLELPGTDWGNDPPPFTWNERERDHCHYYYICMLIMVKSNSGFL